MVFTNEMLSLVCFEQVSIEQKAAVTERTQSAVPVDPIPTRQSGINLLSALPAHHPAGKVGLNYKEASVTLAACSTNSKAG